MHVTRRVKARGRNRTDADRGCNPMPSHSATRAYVKSRWFDTTKRNVPSGTRTPTGRFKADHASRYTKGSTTKCMTGIEPVTSALARRRSATELHAQTPPLGIEPRSSGVGIRSPSIGTAALRMNTTNSVGIGDRSCNDHCRELGWRIS